jgi:hypothetical protein
MVVDLRIDAQCFMIDISERHALKHFWRRHIMMTANRILAITHYEYAEMKSRGETLEMRRNELIDFYSKQDFLTPVAISASMVQEMLPNVHAPRRIFTNFKAIVVASYTVENVFYLELATGDILEIDFVFV